MVAGALVLVVVVLMAGCIPIMVMGVIVSLVRDRSREVALAPKRRAPDPDSRPVYGTYEPRERVVR